MLAQPLPRDAPGIVLEGVRERHGSQEYAREELRAGIASMMTGDQLELGHDTARHARFHPRWTEILHEDPLEIGLASRQVQRICDCVLALERERLRASMEPSVDGTPSDTIDYGQSRD